VTTAAYFSGVSLTLPPDAERFLAELARRSTHEWVRAARAYTVARRSLMFAEARASLGAVLSAAREEPQDAAIAAEIIRRIEDAVRAVRPVVGTRLALRAMRQSATAAGLAFTFRERLTPAEVALLTGAFRPTSVL
jgi:hypothetical protein